MENDTECPICLKKFKGINQHLRLKHGTTPEELYANPDKTSAYPTPISSNTPRKPNTEWDTTLDRMILRMEKLFFVKVLSDAVSGRGDMAASLQNLRNPNTGGALTKDDLMEMLQTGIDIGQKKEEEEQENPTPAQGSDPIMGIIEAALQNPALIEKLLGSVTG